MHECPVCGQMCDCDMEDMEQEAPDDCCCDHEGSGLDESGDPLFDEFEEDDDWEWGTCEFCGCTDHQACPGGCAWSQRYVYQSRAVCTNCEARAIALEINLATLQIWERRIYANPAH